MSRKRDQQKIDVGGQSIAKQRSLRQQIRDIRRLLAKDDIPETVRLTKERIMKSLQGELDDKVAKKQQQKVVKKYRMVKFFEKRKVIRRLNRAGKEYSESDLEEDERAKLLVEINRLRQELNYIVHYPPDEKYIALYPSTTTGSEKAIAKQEDLLQSITESVENGELPDAALEERGVCLPGDMTTKNKDTNLKPVHLGTVSSDPSLPQTTTDDLKQRGIESTSVNPDSFLMSAGGGEVNTVHSASGSRVGLKKGQSTRQQGKKVLRKRATDEGRESDTDDHHINAKKKLKEDTFFLADSDS